MVYLFIIVLLFSFSIVKSGNKFYRFLIFLLYIFLCFGYMCGSDWRVYETEYYNNFETRLVEPGYMLCSNFFSNLGIDFWWFYILCKSFCFYSYYKFFSSIVDNKGRFFMWMLFLCSFGFILFIDCPFRNLIAMSIVIEAFYWLFKKKYIVYYLLVILACTFHLSAVVLLILPILHFEKLSNRILCLIYFSALIFFLLQLDKQLLKVILSPFPMIYNKLFFYEDMDIFQGSVLSVGLILRLIFLFFMLRYRHWIGIHYDNSASIFNLCFIYLLLSLFSYSIPIVYRLPYYLAPFYVLMVYFISQRFSYKNRLIFKSFYLLTALLITYTTVSARPYYIPYTNIIPYAIQGNFPSFEYRDTYNFKNSPYNK